MLFENEMEETMDMMFELNTMRWEVTKHQPIISLAKEVWFEGVAEKIRQVQLTGSV